MEGLLGVAFLLLLWLGLFGAALLGLIGAFDVLKRVPRDPVLALVGFFHSSTEASVPGTQGGGGGAGGAPQEAPAHAEAHPHPKYVPIFVALMVLTVVTVLLSRVHVGHLGNALIAVAVALVKGTLVAAFFMHLKFETKHLLWVLLIPVIFGIAYMLGIFPDIGTLGGGH